MGSFSAIFGPYSNSCEGCDYGKKPKNWPFQNRIVVEFLSPFLLPFHMAFFNLYLDSEISFSIDSLLYVFSQSVFFNFGYFKESLTLKQFSTKLYFGF